MKLWKTSKHQKIGLNIIDLLLGKTINIQRRVQILTAKTSKTTKRSSSLEIRLLKLQRKNPGQK